MHLVFLNQYYPPDAAPTGVMLEGLVEGLLRDGHEVSVLCAVGGYAGKTQDKKTQGTRQEEEANIEHRTPNAQRRTKEDCGCEPRRIAQAPQTTDHGQPSTLPTHLKLRIIRIGASKFGRGSFAGKLMDYASYYVGVALKLLTLRPRPDRIVALTTPPYLSLLARLMSKWRGADHAHWVMDVYPDVLAAHGMLSEQSLAYRLLAALARWGMGGKRCAAILTLGPDMAERVGGRVVSGPLSVVSDCGSEPRLDAQAPQTTDPRQPTTVTWVPLWGTGMGRVVSGPLSVVGDCGTDLRLDAQAPQTTDHRQPTTLPQALALRRARGWGDTDLVVMYSGNMGLGHRFGEILAAAGGGERVVCCPLSVVGDCGSEPRHGAQAPPTTDHRQPTTLPLRFVFFGGGKRRDEVAKFAETHPAADIELHDYAPADQLLAHLQSADVHIASLEPAWSGTMVPSKLQGIFAASRPVIFIGSAESSIGRWVLESGGGWVVAAGDVGGLLEALEHARDPGERACRGRAAKEFAEEHFDQHRNVARVAAILTGR